MNRHSLRARVAVLAALFALVASAQTQSPPAPVTPPKAPAAAPARKAPKAAAAGHEPRRHRHRSRRQARRGRLRDGAARRRARIARTVAIAPEKVRSTLTGREGKARLESLPPGPWNVTVHARGFVHAVAPAGRLGPAGRPAREGRLHHGVVREGRGATAGARRPGVRERGPSRDRRLGGGSHPQRDHDGREGPLPSRRDRPDAGGIVARAPGFDEARREARVGETVELFLFPGATLAGTVRDDEGRPVKGAAVWAEGDRPRRAPPTERTDARGEFLMPGVRPGEYTVVAREGGRAPGIAAVVVEPEAEARVAILLSEGGFVTGRVVDPDGRPLAGRLRVEVVDEHRLPTSTSDADGRGREGRRHVHPRPPSPRRAGDRRLRAAARDAESRGDDRSARRGGPRRRRARDRPRDPRPRARRARATGSRGLGARTPAAPGRAQPGRGHERGRRRLRRRGARAGDLRAHRRCGPGSPRRTPRPRRAGIPWTW